MKTITTIPEMRAFSAGARRAGKRIGFVPTMGYLHEGHLSLVREAKSACDVTVVSIFVNPTQFGPNEDFARYPRDRERDEGLCRAEGVDVVFAPEANEMYAADRSVWVDETSLSEGLCGAARPAHFRGVATVVAKLFNIVRPDVAVFGMKDAQQLRIIQQMVRDLDFPVEIVAAPTVREPDGLAMSSRNRYLSDAERAAALGIHRSLQVAKRRYADGERSGRTLEKVVSDVLAGAEELDVEYVEVVDFAGLQPVEAMDG
ncbi:pantoate--beta-alanine ligase, partial [Verrucomicrobiota bacterium]